MPKKSSRKTVRRSTRRARNEDPEMVSDNDIMTFPEETPQAQSVVGAAPWYKSKTLWAIILVGATLVGVLAFRRGMLVVATVNGAPIFRWDLDNVMLSRFGKQTLEGMISEALIADAARKASVTVSKEELAAKEAEIVQSLGGQTSIDDLLKFQGVTKEDFTKQLTTQLMVQKILSKDISLTDSDIDNFVATAGASLTATEPAALREEARRVITETKVGERVQEWFTKLKNDASVTKFIE